MKEMSEKVYNIIMNAADGINDPFISASIKIIAVNARTEILSGKDPIVVLENAKNEIGKIGNNRTINDPLRGVGTSPINNPYRGNPIGNPFGENKGNNGNKTENDNTNNNPYGFDYGSSIEEEQLEAYINGDIPVFLHGLSGCGKSARVKKLDPNCIVLYLASCKPETISGKTAVINGEVVDIPPPWYTKICELCEKEPDRNHILFLDEITNAPGAIQGLAYNLVLEKDVAGKWKLPDNCKIVAAGNEQDESLAANKIAEPLFRRFAHIYINTTVDKWILWASENKVHPAIISFIASNGLDNNPVFRTKCDGKNPCVDPRKWEMASNLLKKNGKPKELVGILGKDITNKFVEFVKSEIISLDQVLNDKYDQNLRVEPDKAWRVVSALVGVDNDNVKKVVEFFDKHMNPETYTLFKKIWTASGTDKERVNKLRELEVLKQIENDDKNKENKPGGNNSPINPFGGGAINDPSAGGNIGVHNNYEASDFGMRRRA